MPRLRDPSSMPNSLASATAAHPLTASQRLGVIRTKNCTSGPMPNA
jgi:hypothetical protein